MKKGFGDKKKGDLKFNGDLKILTEKIGDVERLFIKIYEKIDINRAPKELINTVKFFENRHRAFQKLIQKNDPGKHDAALLGVSIANSAIKFSGISGDFLTVGRFRAGRDMLLNKASDLLNYCGVAESNDSRPRIRSKENIASIASPQHIIIGPLGTEDSEKILQQKIDELNAAVDGAKARVERIHAEIWEDSRKSTDAKKEEIFKNLEIVVKDANSVLNRINNLHSQSKILAGDMSNAALAKDYAKYSVEENNAANLFRWIGIGAMTIVVAYLGYSLWEFSNSEFDWNKAAFRFLVSFLVSVPIAYVSRESAKHRAQSIELRKTSLDFSALGPYLENIPEPKRSELRAEIAQKVFFSDAKADGSSSFGLDPQAIIMKGMETIADLAKQKKN